MIPDQPEEDSEFNPWQAGQISQKRSRPVRPQAPKAKELLDEIASAAIGLLVVAGISFFLVGWVVVSELFVLEEGRLDSYRFPSLVHSHSLQLAIDTVLLCIHLFIVWGAWNMLKFKRYSISKTVCLIALVPYVSPCCILGIPFGFWGLMALSKLGSKQMFDR